MLPELVFQDVFYRLYIMICSPLHLHENGSLEGFQNAQLAPALTDTAIACLKICGPGWRPMHAARDSTWRQSPAEAKLLCSQRFSSKMTLMMEHGLWLDLPAHLLHLQRVFQAKVPQEIIKELICVAAEGWHLLYLRSWHISIQQFTVSSSSLHLHR